MAFHKYSTWHTKSEPQNLTWNPYGRQVSDNRKEWESEVHINLVATSSILRFEDCLHSSFGLLTANRCSTNELCLLKSDDFHFQRGIRGPSVTLTECQKTGGTWAPKVWRMSLALQKVLKDKVSGRKWKRGVMRDNTCITEIKRVRFMTLNITKQWIECLLDRASLQ